MPPPAPNSSIFASRAPRPATANPAPAPVAKSLRALERQHLNSKNNLSIPHCLENGSTSVARSNSGRRQATGSDRAHPCLSDAGERVSLLDLKLIPAAKDKPLPGLIPGARPILFTVPVQPDKILRF